jgi:DNA processing protein
MNNNVQFRLALLGIPRIGRKTVAKIAVFVHDNYPSTANELYDLCQRATASGVRLPDVGIRTIETALDRANQLMEKSDKLNIKVIPFGDDRLPSLFWDMKEDSPQVIFLKGRVEAINSASNAAVIGTRSPTPWGLKAGKRLSQVLSESGVTIISGLALGCDTAAHEACLDADGVTVAVLAHGLDIVQPVKNRGLAERILDSGGCLISEYEIGKASRPNQFIERDRLQAALSKAVIVIETNIDGGTMHAVKYGQKLGRLLACIKHPDELREISSTMGNQQLIKRGQAIPVKNSIDLKNLINRISKSGNRCVDLGADLIGSENSIDQLSFELE